MSIKLAGSSDYATLAYGASTGDRLWERRYDPAEGADRATALDVSPDGSTVFVTGYSTGSTGSIDYATGAYNATTGAELWVSRYDGPANGFDGASALGISPDGSTLFVTGSSDGSTGYGDYATLAYSTT
jgi:hypothetical protein